MNSSLIIIKSSPYSGRKSHEVIEAVMSLALFEVPHRVVFFGDGLLWLTEPQSAPHQKRLIKQLNALPIYGSDELYYCAEHSTSFDASIKLGEIAEPVPLAQITDWFKDSTQVEVF